MTNVFTSFGAFRYGWRSRPSETGYWVSLPSACSIGSSDLRDEPRYVSLVNRMWASEPRTLHPIHGTVSFLFHLLMSSFAL